MSINLATSLYILSLSFNHTHKYMCAEEVKYRPPQNMLLWHEEYFYIFLLILKRKEVRGIERQ